MTTKSYTHAINPDFGDLAGPYNPESKKEMEWMNNVINDLKLNPSIEYKIVDAEKGYIVQRKGLIINIHE